MKRILLIVPLSIISLAVFGQTGLLNDDNRCFRKEEIRTFKKTIALMKTVNIKSDFWFNAKLSMLKMKPETKVTIKALRHKNLVLSDGFCFLQKNLEYLKSSSEKEISEYSFCKEDNAGNLQLRNIPIKFQLSESTAFDGNLYVTVDKKGSIEEIKVVSGDLQKYSEQLDSCFYSNDSRNRQFLFNRIACLQTQLFIHDMEGIKHSHDDALWISVKDSLTTYGIKNCDMFLLKGIFMPHDVEIRKHIGGRYYRVSMKVDAVASYQTDNNEIVVFWDLLDSDNPCPLVFAWIGKNDKTIHFNDLPLE